MEDASFMEQALALAREAAQEGEVPVGCVIVRKGEIVGRGRNRREVNKSALAHAEVEAIAQVVRVLGRDVATPAEAREILGLKGLDGVNY